MSWGAKESRRLREGLARLNFPRKETLPDKLEAFAREILLWNPSHGLVGTGDFSGPEEAVIHHILDCLAPGKFFLEEEPGLLGDAGSGAGLPGIPLALLLEDFRIVLIEKMGRRCDFLRNVSALLGLKDRVEILQKPLEDLDRSFDYLTFRAFRPLDKAGELFRFLRPGGQVFAYKGRESVWRQEVRGFENWKSYPLDVPFFEGERYMVVIQKPKP